jgi:hypothetical protein
MKKCIEIEIDTDTGQIHVEECAPKEEQGEDGSGGMAAMQAKMGGGAAPEPEGTGGQDFSDIGDALKYVATMLLSGSEGATKAAFADGGGEQAPMAQGTGGM